jgi:CelD/BcsL family acetyltransferase involved in cellulose biosynthesis
MAVLEVGRLNGHAAIGVPGFRVDFMRGWKQAAARWTGAGHGTTFQHHHWLEAWYGAFDSVSPLIAIISNTETDRQVALVPLVRRVHRGIRIVEFADLGLTDYNAPMLGFGTPPDAAEAHALCKALLAALRRLPEGVDLIRWQKMPANVGGRPNPLASLGRMGSSSLNGNLVAIGDDFNVYGASIKRMQMPRCWRVFNRYPGATFRIVTRVEEALALLDTMDAQQFDRMRQLGLKFVLNDDRCAKFYRDIVSRGVGTGYLVVSALTCDDAVVATTLGIRQGANYVLLRTSNAGKRWSNCSPGLLVIERTMAALHQDGVRQFDLSIGNYGYKRRFGATQFPLTDVTIALGWRGFPYMMRDRAVQWLRRYPRLAKRLRRALGRPPQDDES